MLLFITGVPGSGKTTFGNWLNNTRSYYHFDMEEDLRGNEELKAKWRIGLEFGDYSKFVDGLHELANKVVLTWGFPEEAIHLALHSKHLKVDSFWFDGDRQFFRNSWLRREQLPEDDPKECYFDYLCAQVTQKDIEEAFEARIITVSSSSSKYLPYGAVWEMISSHLRAMDD